MSKYSKRQKAHALELYVQFGPCRAMKETGIPKSTITRWAKAAGLSPPTGNITEGVKAAEAKLAEQRARVKQKCLDRAEEMLDRMGEPMKIWVGSGATPVEVALDKAPAGVCKDLSVTAGTLIDKFLLLNGEANGRHEVTGPGGAPIVTSIVVELPAPAAEEAPDGAVDDKRDGGAEA